MAEKVLVQVQKKVEIGEERHTQTQEQLKTALEGEEHLQDEVHRERETKLTLLRHLLEYVMRGDSGGGPMEKEDPATG